MLEHPRRVEGLLLVLVLSASTAWGGAGENGLAFLKVGVGTDAVGMGHAYTSQVRDASATYWNPAGLSRAAGTDFLLTHNEFISDIRMEYAAVARSFGRHGLGLSFAGLFAGDLEGRDENGRFTGDVGYHDIALTLGYSFAASEALTGGLGVKYLREFIGDPGASDDHVANGLAADFGAQYHVERFALGGVVQNVGSQMEFNRVQTVSQDGLGPTVGGQPFDLPLAVQGGVTYFPSLDVMGGGVEVALEGRQVRGEDFGVLFGARYRYREIAALSVGYRTGLDTENVSFGLRVNRDALAIGYAFVPFSDDLGNSHRFSLGYHLD
jgi:hypothetical protein